MLTQEEQTRRTSGSFGFILSLGAVVCVLMKPEEEVATGSR